MKDESKQTPLRPSQHIPSSPHQVNPLETFIARHLAFQYQYKCFYEDEGWTCNYQVDVFRVMCIFDGSRRSDAVWENLYASYYPRQRKDSE